MPALSRYVPRAPSQLLAHILDRPELVSAIRELPAATLSRLVQHIGVEDAGELVALASTDQIAALLDEELWRADESSFEEQFDPQRFALWLRVMGEAGDEFLLRRLCELPVDLLTLAIQRLVLVIDMDALHSFYAGASDELGEVERALEHAPVEEWEEFCLIARDVDAWEDAWNALLLLDRDHHERLRSMLEQCCAISLEYINGQGGLYEVLSSDEMLESDARATRDDRRATEGYVANSDAHAFLALARDEPQPVATRDPLTAAYFRALETTRSTRPTHSTSRGLAPPQAMPGVATLMQLVAEFDGASGTQPGDRRRLPATKQREVAGTARRSRKSQAHAHTRAADEPQTIRAALERDVGHEGQPTLEERPLLAALTQLASSDSTKHAARMDELGYLANVLLSGCEHSGRKLRPVEALEAAVATSNLGFELWARDQSARSAESDLRLLAEIGCDRMFRQAWSKLQRDLVHVATRVLRERSSQLDRGRAHRAHKSLEKQKPYELRNLCDASELALDDVSFAELVAWAEPLPWQPSDTAKASQRTGSRWFATRAELERARQRLAVLAAFEPAQTVEAPAAEVRADLTTGGRRARAPGRPRR